MLLGMCTYFINNSTCITACNDPKPDLILPLSLVNVVIKLNGHWTAQTIFCNNHRKKNNGIQLGIADLLSCVSYKHRWLHLSYSYRFLKKQMWKTPLLML